MAIIQTVLVILFVLAVINTIIRYFKRDVNLSGLILWLLFWTAASGVVLWPDATFYFSKKMGIGRGADLIVYLALVLLFFLVFRLMLKVEKQKREITILARLVSLKDKTE